MKRLSITLLALLLIGGAASAQAVVAYALNSKQVAQLDVTGKWTGTRQQYAWDHKSFIETFTYEFDLVQQGNIVTGTSTIMNSDGDFADMKLTGIIIGNKLHFSETQITGAIRPTGRVWCYKSGELNFAMNGNDLMLVGATSSYMEETYMPCSGGVTNLTKADNSNNDMATIMKTGTAGSASGAAPDINITAYPNPFVQSATIQYNLPADAKVEVDVYNINGQLLTTLFDGNQKAGNGYKLAFNASGNTQSSGVYIVKMTVNGEVYSRQLVQML